MIWVSCKVNILNSMKRKYFCDQLMVKNIQEKLQPEKLIQSLILFKKEPGF